MSRYSRRQRKLFFLGCLMASVILGTILLSVVVIIIADIPNSVGSNSFNMSPESLAECHWQDWRLPSNVTPTAYTLQLQTQMQEPFAVVGSMEVELSIAQPTLCLVLSAAAMNITGAPLKQPNLAGRALAACHHQNHVQQLRRCTWRRQQ